MVDPLLALCARAVSHSGQRQRLVTQAQIYTDWSSLPWRAEGIALAPLTYTHIQAANIDLPEDSRRALTALALRHRRANAIRFEVLAEILTALKHEDIGVLLLKGAALAHTVYPHPGLRPMRDMDILVDKRNALRGQEILADLGFDALVPDSVEELALHHLPIAQRTVDGLTVSLELHHQLLPDPTQSLSFEQLSADSFSFSINGVAAKTLSHENMLWHIYIHSFAYPMIAQPIRLIWVADFISLVEKNVDKIDWEQVRRRFPQVWNVLPVFHFLSPWSGEVLNRLDLKVDPPPKGVGLIFQGWPESSLAKQRKKGIGRFLKDTFWPPEWWTWLYYGVDRQSLIWPATRFLRHPLHIVGLVLQYLRKRY